MKKLRSKPQSKFDSGVQAVKALKKLSSPARAKSNAWFFKTKPGEYGFGDVFLGNTVPQVRLVLKNFTGLALSEVKKLLQNKYHEARLLALLILVRQFNVGAIHELPLHARRLRKQVYNLYLKNTKFINNWDLVDLSAPHIVGGYLYEDNNKNWSILQKLAKAKLLWERRIAILATLYFTVKKDSEPALKISKLLLNDDQDLMHKAVGWMLREVGKRCGANILRKFLRENYNELPRTTLRYAIERFKKSERKKWLIKKKFT